MGLPSTEAFARLVRSLSASERVAFVADIWAARGWNITVEGDTIVATREGTELRVRVVDPGRLRTPSIGDADVVVTTRDRASLRDATRAGDAEYVPPADLRDALLYGVDRETAAALFEATFDKPLDAEAPHVEPPLTEQFRRMRDVLERPSRSVAGRPKFVAAVLLVALLGGVAVAGSGVVPGTGGSAADIVVTGTYTPGEAGAIGATPTPTAAAASPTSPTPRQSYLPPGIGERGIDNVSTLVKAHQWHVSGRSRVLRLRAEGPPNASYMADRSRWNYTARVERPWVYRFDAEYADLDNGSRVDVSVYASGGVNYRRITADSGVTYQRYPTGSAGYADKYTRDVGLYLDAFLRGERSVVDCVGEDELTCRVVVRGAPSEFTNAEDYSARAVVKQSGIVYSLSVSYTYPDTDGDGDREPVSFRLDYEGLNETTISDPDWLPAAKNATED